MPSPLPRITPRRAVRVSVLAFSCIASALALWSAAPVLHWPDRRPIASLFLASHFHSSPVNPRGWFNDRSLDALAASRSGAFRNRVLSYAAETARNMHRYRAQGVIVWDIEGEQYPHKISFIGDPRLLSRLAPEMDAVADELFTFFKRQGFRVGVTIRPQEFKLSSEGAAQLTPWNYERVLLDKIRYARRRWGADLFYIDSNGGILWPLEPFHLKRIALAEPGILLVPEHQGPLHYGSGAPYDRITAGSLSTPSWIRILYGGRAFSVLNLAGNIPSNADAAIVGALADSQTTGDVFMFRGWFDSDESKLLERIQTH